jgi:hypothetical protein
MKRLVLGAAALAILSGLAFTAPSAEAAPYGYGNLTPYERAALARSRADLRVLKWRARADGHVSRWERRRIHAAQARHDALAFRYRHN